MQACADSFTEMLRLHATYGERRAHPLVRDAFAATPRGYLYRTGISLAPRDPISADSFGGQGSHARGTIELW
jgi:hypothetical protein